MVRFLSDQNKLAGFYESGLYANPSGTAWFPGIVQSYDIPESLNIQQVRFMGQGNRNVGIFFPGQVDVEGTIKSFPQELRFLGLALGSQFKTSGTNNTFSLSEVNGEQRFNAYTSGTLNPWFSFTLEESRNGAIANQNFMRTVKGCVVDELAYEVTQGNPISETISFFGQVGSWFSGTSSTITAGSSRPYIWADTILSIDGATQETVNKATFKIKNNFQRPHYANGSLVMATPYPLNRDYTMDVTADLDSAMMGSLYDTYFKGGSKFNATWDWNNINDIGSHHATFYFSGCKVVECTSPAELSSVSQLNYTFVPGSVNAIVYTREPLYSMY